MPALSVRIKITLLYTGILAITLLLFSLLVYQNFRSSMHRNQDGLLKSKAEGVADSIETYWATEELDAVRDGAKLKTLTKINNINFLKITQRWIQEKSDDPDLMNILIQIFGADGNIIASSKDIPEIRSIPGRILQSISQGKAAFYDQEVRMPGKDTLPLRILVLPIMEKGRVTYTVQVSSPLAVIRANLNGLKAILFFILPLTVILTGIAGLLLVWLTLRPVDKMIRALHQIKSENLTSKIPVPKTKDELRRLAETFNDLLDKLEKDFLMQRQFNQDLSHELRTPLTILKGELEVTMKKLRAPREYESVLQSSLEEINKIQRILDQLLMLARFENKEISLRIAPVDLKSLIEQTLDDIRILADQRRIGIDVRADKSVACPGDADQLRTVVMNLLDNAIKYTPPGGTLRLDLGEEGNDVKIAVCDTGIGIPEDKIPFIFNRFFRIEDSRSSSGFGLGLSIAKTIVEAHGGRIKVESRPGAGSTFTVTLPKRRTV